MKRYFLFFLIIWTSLQATAGQSNPTSCSLDHKLDPQNTELVYKQKAKKAFQKIIKPKHKSSKLRVKEIVKRLANISFWTGVIGFFGILLSFVLPFISFLLYPFILSLIIGAITGTIALIKFGIAKEEYSKKTKFRALSGTISSLAGLVLLGVLAILIILVIA